MAFMVEPTLAITQANVNALQSVLRMEKAQVRLVRALDAAAACCARDCLVCMCMHCRSFSRASLELLHHRLQEQSPLQPASNVTAGAHNDA